MDPLQAVLGYWLDCIKSESSLEQSFGLVESRFSLQSRVRAKLFTDTLDPFIFREGSQDYELEPGGLYNMMARAKLKGQDICFGYPLLMFFDKTTKQHQVTPLFVMRLEADLQKDRLTLSRAELSPTLGNLAFEKLGLQQDAIVTLNQEVAEVFEATPPAKKLDVILYLLKKETHLTFIEGINPDKLSSATDIQPYDGTVIYNKALFYVSEASSYNLHLLNDLEQLVKRHDLQDSSLRYLTTQTRSNTQKITPVLPFPFDEYQLLAIQNILGSEHTVVTGPPGTGKSQFIANLVINLFLQKKRVLFVSHTGEAVRVVNERINTSFKNLMMQTGKKEIRQDLGRRLEEMVAQYNSEAVNQLSETPFGHIAHNWKNIVRESTYVRHTDRLSQQLKMATSIGQTLADQTALRSRSKKLVSEQYVNVLAVLLRRRRSSREVLQHIDELKAQHVELSRDYVQANYLKLILDNGQYGSLLAYIEAVQNKKFTTGDDALDTSDQYIRAALNAMNIWSCTLKSLAATFPLKANLFDYVIFDEASQIDLPAAAPALYRAAKIVVVGDENQLSHIAKISAKLEDELAHKHELPGKSFYPRLVKYTDTSLFNSAKRALKRPEQQLKNHYRSHAEIAQLFSDIFYDGKLNIYEPDITLPPDIKPGYYWLDVKGAGYQYRTGSRYNPQEAHYIVELMKRLLPIANEHHLSIGIATPYSKQRDVITDEVEKIFKPEVLTNARILSVHQFQGSEVDILLFSPVLAQKGDGNSEYWFMKNRQILNVAISRAKQLLLIAGDLDFALQAQSKLKEIAERSVYGRAQKHKVPLRPMNVFEKKLLELLQNILPKSYDLEPQYVVDGRFTVDFAALSKHKMFAIELDGRQHEIIGGLPVFEDRQRDAYLSKAGWQVLRIRVHELVKQPDQVEAFIKQRISSNA
jgi:very-short-patch-repair endonuclease